MNMTSNCEVTKKHTPNTNDHHMPLNEPPHENCLRTPLTRPTPYEWKTDRFIWIVSGEAYP